MRHHLYNPNFIFQKEPIEFNKYTNLNILKYCLGASMYMPGTKDFTNKIFTNWLPGLTSMVMCFEDACPEDEVELAEANTLRMLESLGQALEEGRLSYERIPLIFCRVRNMEQFRSFAEQLTPRQVRVLAGINFPKFNTRNGWEYFSYLKELNERFSEIIYGMPIIEDEVVAHKETRISELLGIKEILDTYKDIVLQVRVGATDFSSVFGARRGIDYTIYDILPVRDCLSDIINVFSRDNAYVVSGPVWEYFRASKEMMFKDLPKHDINGSLLKREPIFNDAVDGLLREVILDKANGFVGRTVIHPTHVKFVNAMQAVTLEEYEDACQILGTKGGVIKSGNANKMNEVKPHTNWADKIYHKALAYGVIKDGTEYVKLFSVND